MNKLEKRTSENKTFDVDCSGILRAGEVIQGTVTASVSPTTSPALAVASPTISQADYVYDDPVTGVQTTVPTGQVLSARISGGKIPTGLTKQDYIIRFQFATSLDPAVEATVILSVNDTPVT